MRRGTPFEVLRAFLVLGVSSFGGPVAHLGYFRRAFVEERGWLSAEEFGAILSLCQFLPGPASSQAGLCIGLKRAGLLGGLAAWLGFTLPSAALMVLAALVDMRLRAYPVMHDVVHGLQLAAVAVVAQAVYQMAVALCPDTPRRALALLAAAILALMPDTGGQLIVLLIGGAIGWLALDDSTLVKHREKRRLAREFEDPGAAGRVHGAALILLLVFLLLLGVSFLVPKGGVLGLAASFYRSGALVFGGGHVVLPLLRDAVVVPGLISPQLFLAGYGVAQALPGPLFTVAAFLGQTIAGPVGAVVALLAIFTPGLLLVAGALPYWEVWRQRPYISAVVKGLNAAVVGLLGAALVNLFTLSTVQGVWDFPVIIGALMLLTMGKARPILVVLFCAGAGALF
ncbi:chromate efflux transporter [Acidocella sp.]|uniref:chromate efflux transporter n=1 Tax=Acidocella sp. TaxID=50710 RepID=UPI0026107241|nr:chromate efflux transporter [Acidocella sp.]